MAPAEADPRRTAILAAALQVFSRYGYKKTSMDEVARAADLSRPGLYFHFASKEELFVAALVSLLDQTLAAAAAAIHRPGPLADRLVAALLAAHQHFVASATPDPGHLDELLTSARTLASREIAAHEAAFLAMLTEGLAPELPPGCPIDAGELAALVETLSVGVKHQSADIDAYRVRVERAIRALLALLSASSPARSPAAGDRR